MIEFRDIHKRFGSKVVLAGVTLTVQTGSIFFIIGQSGAGKSVLVKHLVGLIRPDAGRILLDGEDITDLTERQYFAVRKRCAMVFQHATLFDSLSLVENVALPLRKHRRMGHREAVQSARGYLERVQMDHLASSMPADIGDGLRKRVAIARALTFEPSFVIFDEPTTALDPMAAANVDELIRALSDEQGVTSIVVSHDLRSIFGVADRIAMLYEGRVLLDGSPQQFCDTEDAVVRQFISGSADGPIVI